MHFVSKFIFETFPFVSILKSFFLIELCFLRRSSTVIKLCLWKLEWLFCQPDSYQQCKFILKCRSAKFSVDDSWDAHFSAADICMFNDWNFQRAMVKNILRTFFRRDFNRIDAQLGGCFWQTIETFRVSLYLCDEFKPLLVKAGKEIQLFLMLSKFHSFPNEALSSCQEALNWMWGTPSCIRKQSMVQL